MAPSDSPTRSAPRYEFAFPVTVELSQGFLRPADRVPGRLVDMSVSGAAIVMAADPRLKLKRRYRVILDDHVGIITVKNLVPGDGGDVRLGVEFMRLGLELQEIVSDAIHEAQWAASRLDQATALRGIALTADR